MYVNAFQLYSSSDFVFVFLQKDKNFCWKILFNVTLLYFIFLHALSKHLYFVLTFLNEREYILKLGLWVNIIH